MVRDVVYNQDTDDFTVTVKDLTKDQVELLNEAYIHLIEFYIYLSMQQRDTVSTDLGLGLHSWVL